MLSTIKDNQYYGGCSVPWRMFCTVNDILYCGECQSCEGIPSVVTGKGQHRALRGILSTVKDNQCYGGCSVPGRLSFTVKDIQYCEAC